ncbi:MAG: hypothetical protein U1F52_05175 [Burkholderiales bacterium]
MSRMGDRFRRLVLLATTGCVLAFGGMVNDQALAQSHADGSSIEGDWRGPWYLGMSSGIATLRLTKTDDGSGLNGSIQLTNNEKFGDEAARLLSMDVRDGHLVFRAAGADGQVMDARLAIPARDPGVLKGAAKYGGYKVRLELTKAQDAKK